MPFRPALVLAVAGLLSLAAHADAALVTGVVTPGESELFTYSWSGGSPSAVQAAGSLNIGVSGDGKSISIIVNNFSGTGSSITGFGFNTTPDLFSKPFTFYLVGQQKASDNSITTVLLGSNLGAKGASVTIGSNTYTNLGKWNLEYDNTNKAFGVKTDGMADVNGASYALHDPTQPYANNHTYITTAMLVMTFTGANDKFEPGANPEQGVAYKYDTATQVVGGSDPTLSPILRFQEVPVAGSLKLTPTNTPPPDEIPPPPLPEPASLAIWSLGLALAGFGARRLRKAT